MSALIETTIYSSILILAVLAIKAIWQPKLNYKIVSFLWLLVLVRLLLPITIESPIHVASFIPEDKINTVAQESTTNTLKSEVYQPNIETTVTQDNYAEPISLSETTFTPSTQVDEKSTFWQTVWNNMKSMSIWDYLLYIWLAGMIALLSKNLYQLFMFNRKVKSCKSINSKQILDIVERNRRKLSIDKNVNVINCHYTSSPVTFGLFNPKILLPVDIENKITNERLEMIIMHELMHVKRHDLIFSFLWLIVKCVHWYNPLVWIAFKEFMDDTEFAVDGEILKKCNKAEAYEYSQGIIDVIRLSNKLCKVPIALSFCTDNKIIRKRIKNMITPTKKLKSTGFVSIVLALMMVVVCFTTACQPMTDTKVAEQEEAIEYEKLEYEAPDRLEFDIQSDLPDLAPLEVKVDADVILPENVLSQASVNHHDISYKTISNLLDLLANGESLYDATQVMDILTKDVIERRIEKYTNLIEFHKENPNNFSKEQIPDLEAEIKRLSDLYESAPENYSDATITVPAGMEDMSPAEIRAALITSEENITYDDLEKVEIPVKPVIIDEENYMNGYSLLIGEGGLEKITFNTNQINMGLFDNEIHLEPRISYHKGLVENEFGTGSVETRPLREEDYLGEISLEDAKETAQKYVDAIDPSLVLTDIAEAYIKIYSDEVDSLETTNHGYGYTLYYGRSYNGVLAKYSSSITLMPNFLTPEEEAVQLSEVTLPQEFFAITIGPDGIHSLKYYAPSETTEYLSSNLELLPFNEIETIFRDNIVYNSASVNSPSIYISIDRIELHMMTIKIPNSEEYMAVPVWDFYGRSGPTNWDMVTDNYGHSYLTINAIDGSIITRDRIF